MRKTILLTLAVAAVALPVSARTAADFFVEAPRSVLPLVEGNTRLDMLDYFRYGSPTPSANVFDGQALVTAESEGAVSYELTRNATGQLAVIPAGRDTLLMVITTVATPAPDSRVEFFTSDWKPLPRSVLAAPTVADWLVGTPDDTEPVEFVLSRADYDPATGRLTYTHSMDGYFARKPDFLRDTVVYAFDGKKFRKPKD